MRPDGRTRILFIPDLAPSFRGALRQMIKVEEAAAREALLAAVQELGESPMFRPLPIARPKNWRPWHKHTLPTRKGKR